MKQLCRRRRVRDRKIDRGIRVCRVLVVGQLEAVSIKDRSWLVELVELLIKRTVLTWRNRSILHDECSGPAPSYPCGNIMVRALCLSHFAEHCQLSNHEPACNSQQGAVPSDVGTADKSTPIQLTLGADDKRIDHALRSIMKVPKLSFPDRQQLGARPAHPDLEPYTCQSSESRHTARDSSPKTAISLSEPAVSQPILCNLSVHKTRCIITGKTYYWPTRVSPLGHRTLDSEGSSTTHPFGPQTWRAWRPVSAHNRTLLKNHRPCQRLRHQPLRECTPANILPRYPDIIPLLHQTPKSHSLGSRKVDLAIQRSQPRCDMALEPRVDVLPRSASALPLFTSQSRCTHERDERSHAQRYQVARHSL
jgi:hypothetical protein